MTQGPGTPIRSKIEDKPTEEKLKDRESATYPNTPWAPSGPERIEVACGKVPLQAHRDGGVRRPGCLVFSQGALLKVFQTILSEIWEPKASQRERKGTATNSKWNKKEPTRPKWNQKGTKRVPTDAKVAPKSCLGAFEVLGFLH